MTLRARHAFIPVAGHGVFCKSFHKRTPEGIMDESAFFKHNNIHERFRKFVKSSTAAKENTLIAGRLREFLQCEEILER